MLDAQSPRIRIAVVALIALIVGSVAGIALGGQFAGDDEEPIPRAATPIAATVRIEGDDTELKQLLIGLSSFGADSTYELATGELPRDFPETFPAVPGATLLGGQTSTYPMSPGLRGAAVYRTEQAPEVAFESLIAAAEAAGWWQPELPDYYPLSPIDTPTAQFCLDDWARTGLGLNASATPDGQSGSYVTIRYWLGQGGSQCDPQAFGPPASGYVQPQLLREFQQLRPEGSTPDFRFGGGMSSSGDTFSTSTGFRFDGSALTVARFYERELATLEATADEPLGDETSAVLRVSTIEQIDDEEHEFVGWIVVTRFEDEEDPTSPLIRVELMLMSLPDGLTRQGSSEITLIR